MQRLSKQPMRGLNTSLTLPPIHPENIYSQTNACWQAIHAISFYEEQAIKRGMPLTSGIGSPAIDKNSIENLDVTKLEMAEMAKSHVAAIKRVCEAIELPEDNHVRESWPSHIYFEDVNGESQFDLIEIILDEVYKSPPIEQSDTAVALEA